MYSEILSNMIINKVYWSMTMYTEKGVKVRRHNRERWGIICKYEGETEYVCNGKTSVSNINNFVILPKGCSYEWSCNKAGHFSMIEFESDSTWDEILEFPIRNGEKILRSFKELEYKMTLKRPMYEVESIRDVYSIILQLAQMVSQKYLPQEKHKKISPAIDHIAKNYNKNITNDELAGLTGLSTVYFRKLFTEIMGVSPINYVHQLRIKKAKEMLKTDYGSITEIAQSLGYPNIYDFSRTFKKHTGVSPSRY